MRQFQAATTSKNNYSVSPAISGFRRFHQIQISTFSHWQHFFFKQLLFLKKKNVFWTSFVHPGRCWSGFCFHFSKRRYVMASLTLFLYIHKEWCCWKQFCHCYKFGCLPLERLWLTPKRMLRSSAWGHLLHAQEGRTSTPDTCKTSVSTWDWAHGPAL